MRSRNLAGALEAVIGAIWVDQGLEPTTKFVLAQLQDQMSKISAGGQSRDYKSRLQELSQARWREQPRYHTVEQKAPNGDRLFTAEAMVDGQVMGMGTGSSKRAAQREAAKEALERLAEE